MFHLIVVSIMDSFPSRAHNANGRPAWQLLVLGGTDECSYYIEMGQMLTGSDGPLENWMQLILLKFGLATIGANLTANDVIININAER